MKKTETTKFQKMLREFSEQISAFLRRGRTEAEGRKMLVDHCGQLRQQISEMKEVPSEFSDYAALAFWGQLQFARTALVEKLIGDRMSPAQMIAELRKKSALSVTVDAKDLFTRLEAENADILWDVIALNFLKIKNKSAEEDEADETEGE